MELFSIKIRCTFQLVSTAYHTKYIAKVEKKGDFIWFFKYYVYICSEISIRYL